jgi:hypothetical protein
MNGSSPWVYVAVGDGFRVGFYDPEGVFHEDVDLFGREHAARRVGFLNGMGTEMAEQVAGVLATADGGCEVCTEKLAKEAAQLWPEHDWAGMVEAARGRDDDG